MQLTAAGSSPPVRGAHGASFLSVGRVGLIPARAGSTAQAGRHVRCLWAHPRPCGEHARAEPVNSPAAGSSPPVRGAHNHITHMRAGFGLIPARAGSTGANAHSYRRRRAHPRPCGEHGEPECNATNAKWAHPRPCGEHLNITDQLETSPGSSPPVRGALVEVLDGAGHFGLIPARAGSTYRRYRPGFS